jgi:hypothetical protein
MTIADVKPANRKSRVSGGESQNRESKEGAHFLRYSIVFSGRRRALLEERVCLGALHWMVSYVTATAGLRLVDDATWPSNV